MEQNDITWKQLFEESREENKIIWNERAELLLKLKKLDAPDSIEAGTAGKGGCIKVYGNFENIEGFKSKIDNAIVLREYANQKLSDGKSQ